MTMMDNSKLLLGNARRNDAVIVVMPSLPGDRLNIVRSVGISLPTRTMYLLRLEEEYGTVVIAAIVVLVVI